jgi:hypothetical protein
MIKVLISEFHHIIVNCLNTIRDKHTFVYEDKDLNRGRFVTSQEQYHLHIENQANESFYFIQNDGCVMNNVRGGQCDYIILNSISIYFTDVKVAKGNYKNHRSDAYKQIENTYKHLVKRIDFPEHFNLHALVCFPSPRRIVKASASTKRREFKEYYNIDLQEGNYILLH